MLFTEFAPGSGSYHATVGWTMHTWFGDTPFKHELYHTRQYIYMGDWLIPLWCPGTIWGVVAAAISSKHKVSAELAFGASGEVGNPIEVAAYRLGQCAIASRSLASRPKGVVHGGRPRWIAGAEQQPWIRYASRSLSLH